MTVTFLVWVNISTEKDSNLSLDLDSDSVYIALCNCNLIAYLFLSKKIFSYICMRNGKIA